MGLNGYISCQELRAAFPNALPNYVMGYTLFEKDVDVEELIEEYFQACYGQTWETVLDYLTELSDLSSCDYINGKGERCNPQIAERMKRIFKRCHDFENFIMAHCSADEGWNARFWEILEYHRNYILLFSETLYLLALGNKEQADLKWESLREYICSNEEKYQPFLDVYRILEVTQKYTGLHR